MLSDTAIVEVLQRLLSRPHLEFGPIEFVRYQVNYHAAVRFLAYVRCLAQYLSPAEQKPGTRLYNVGVPAHGYYRSSRHGRIYLYYGGIKHSMDNTCDCTFTGDTPKSSPYRVSVADFNGDGYGDIVMSRWLFNNSRGRCWLWYGGPESSTEVNFFWDTATASIGKHTLKVEIPPVPGKQKTDTQSGQA